MLQFGFFRYKCISGNDPSALQELSSFCVWLSSDLIVIMPGLSPNSTSAMVSTLQADYWRGQSVIIQHLRSQITDEDTGLMLTSSGRKCISNRLVPAAGGEKQQLT